MSRRRSSFYDREFVAIKSRLLARMMAPDSETSLAMDVVIVAVEVGADIVCMAEKIGVAADLILPLEGRLREAQLWNGRQVDAREWLHITNDRDRMMVIYVQARVATESSKENWLMEAPPTVAGMETIWFGFRFPTDRGYSRASPPQNWL